MHVRTVKHFFLHVARVVHAFPRVVGFGMSHSAGKRKFVIVALCETGIQNARTPNCTLVYSYFKRDSFWIFLNINKIIAILLHTRIIDFGVILADFWKSKMTAPGTFLFGINLFFLYSKHFSFYVEPFLLTKNGSTSSKVEQVCQNTVFWQFFWDMSDAPFESWSSSSLVKNFSVCFNHSGTTWSTRKRFLIFHSLK